MPDCGRECVDAEEEAYFFRMSKYADRLMDYINEHPEFIQPESRKNEMVNNFFSRACRICASPAPPSAGAFLWTLTPVMWSMSGWMH